MQKVCGESMKVMLPLFQEDEGGAIPTTPLQYKIEECKFATIRPILEQYHYKGGHIGGGISHCLCLRDNAGRAVAGVVVGKLRHDKAYSKGVKKVLELRRMACLDACPKNTESYFLSKVLWWLKKNSDVEQVVSYSDQSVGHAGTIYKAANFKLIGETAPTKHVYWNGVRYHPRSLTIDRPYSYRLRAAIKEGSAHVETGKPKLVFSYEIRR